MEKQSISTISSDSDELISPEQLNRILNYDLRRTRKTPNFFKLEQIQPSKKRSSNRKIKLNIWEKYLINSSSNSDNNLSESTSKIVENNNIKFNEILKANSLLNQNISNSIKKSINNEEISNLSDDDNSLIRYKISLRKNNKINLKSHKIKIDPVKQEAINKIFSKNANIIKNKKYNLNNHKSEHYQHKIDKHHQRKNQNLSKFEIVTASDDGFTTPSVSPIYQNNSNNEIIKFKLQNENLSMINFSLEYKLKELFSDDGNEKTKILKTSIKHQIKNDEILENLKFAQNKNLERRNYKNDFQKIDICNSTEKFSYLPPYDHYQLKETNYPICVLDDSSQSVSTPESLKLNHDNFVNTINIISPLDSEDDGNNVKFKYVNRKKYSNNLLMNNTDKKLYDYNQNRYEHELEYIPFNASKCYEAPATNGTLSYICQNTSIFNYAAKQNLNTINYDQSGNQFKMQLYQKNLPYKQMYDPQISS